MVPEPAVIPEQPDRFDGWWVVASVFGLLMVNSGLGFYGLSVFLDAVTEEQGFSIGDASFAITIFFIVSALAGRVVAPIIQRHDLRLVVAAGAVVAAGGLLLIGQATSLVALYSSYIVFAVGVGMSGLVPGTTLVTRWFHARRSVALSIASTGLSIGGVTITLVVSAIIDRLGMSGASPWLALIYLGVVAISLVKLWPDPRSRGQQPDGRAIGAADPAPGESAGMSYDDAIRTRFFALITIAFVLAMGAQVGAMAQLFKLGVERAGDGRALVSAVALASFIARLAGGVVAARVKLIAMTCVLAALQGCSLLWLSRSESQFMLIAATVLFGCTVGNLLMLQPLVIADRFGVAAYPRIFALCQLIVTGLGVAGGPYLLGQLRDVRSYTLSYTVAACLSIGGAAVFLLAWKSAPVDRDAGRVRPGG